MSADRAKLDDRRCLGPIKLALGLPLKLSQKTTDILVILELAALHLDLEHVLSCAVDEHTPCLYALAHTDFLEDELWRDLRAPVQGRVDSGSSSINNSKYSLFVKPLGRLGRLKIVEGVMY